MGYSLVSSLPCSNKFLALAFKKYSKTGIRIKGPNKVNKSKGSLGKLRNVFPKAFSSIFCLFVYLLFLLCTWISSEGHQRFAEQSRKGGDHTHSSLPLPLTRERLGTYLYVGWVLRILNCISCNYQAAARWGLSSSMN